MGSIAIESTPSPSAPRILIIGAGQRGNHYSKPLRERTNAIIAAVAEPNKFKRQKLGETYIWGLKGKSQEGQEFCDWKDFINYEVERRQRASRGEMVPEGVDGVFVCTLDDQHKEIIIALAPLNLHIMSEKPLATTLEDCISIYASLLATEQPTALFTIGHVLRYSPHNVLLHELIVKDMAIGEVLSMEHTEPVGWWHFSHSYVRGNWRKESSTAPSLLTKSCHDIDFLLWLLCSPTPGSSRPAHLPSLVTSSGSLVFFKKSRKPTKAGNATNCLSCPIERDCLWSAKKLYYEKGLGEGHLDRAWYSCKVVPEIEDCVNEYDLERAQQLLLPALARDYDEKTTPQVEIDAQPWYGRCVFEAANDVCDDQVVTIDWADDPLLIEGADQEKRMERRSAKKAIFHMVAWTEKICQRRSRIYGSKGEIETDGETIIVHDFESNTSKTYKPPSLGGHHGGGDAGLATQFIKAIDAVKNQGMSVADAQVTHIGCSVEEIIRSHAMVFAAEDSRKQVKVVEWVPWWNEKVEKRLGELRG